MLCQVCDKPMSSHVYPERTPCPKCERIEPVMVWEAWGHPNGELYCQDCAGFTSGEPAQDYFTWHVQDGEPVIHYWQPG